MAAKFFTGLPLDGPDPECVKGYGELALSKTVPGSAPKPSLDHSNRGRAPRAKASGPVPITLGRRPEPAAGPVPLPDKAQLPDKACDENPLAGLALPSRG